MTEHIHWTCDGCQKIMTSKPQPVTLSMIGVGGHDRTKSFDLCGSCISRAQVSMWPDYWVPDAEQAA